jgi:hypothetical protein
MNLSESLLHALKAHGAREIFGIPGDFALAFFKVIEESKILPLYTLSHEPGVGFAADAAARLHSSIGVAVVTYGAGALNMVNPVAAAYAERSPRAGRVCCCTIRRRRWIRSIRSTPRSPAIRCGWTMHSGRRPISLACLRVRSRTRGRCTSSCRATW